MGPPDVVPGLAVWCTLFRYGLRPNLKPDICSVGLTKILRASCDGPPWECATPEVNLAEGCRSPLEAESHVNRLAGLPLGFSSCAHSWRPIPLSEDRRCYRHPALLFHDFRRSSKAPATPFARYPQTVHSSVASRHWLPSHIISS